MYHNNDKTINKHVEAERRTSQAARYKGRSIRELGIPIEGRQEQRRRAPLAPDLYAEAGLCGLAFPR
jgi:hypothetical protein